MRGNHNMKPFIELPEDFRIDIFNSLREEYIRDEVDDMLFTAVFDDSDPLWITVIYDNSNTDFYKKVTRLQFYPTKDWL